MSKFIFMQITFFIFSLFFSLTVCAGYVAEYPQGPLPSLTPGKLCERPDSYRYPERIAYCNRDVDPDLKAEIFRDYRQEGYRLNPKERRDYKIDHLIPLCAGGSNSEDNLWPQHMSIYAITDQLESLGCEKLKLGKILQRDLVNMIIAAKKDLNLVPQTIDYLSRL